MSSRAFWLSTCLLALLAACFPSLGFAGDSKQRNNSATNDILVRLALGVDALAFAKAMKLVDNPQAIDALGGEPIYYFTIADGDTPSSKAAKLAADPRVVYAEPNYEGRLPEARQRSSWVVGDACVPCFSSLCLDFRLVLEPLRYNRLLGLF